jgi:hypothetical protein
MLRLAAAAAIVSEVNTQSSTLPTVDLGYAVPDYQLYQPSSYNGNKVGSFCFYHDSELMCVLVV